MGSISLNFSENKGAFYTYRASKAALNSGCVSLAHDMKDDGYYLISYFFIISF